MCKVLKKKKKKKNTRIWKRRRRVSLFLNREFPTLICSTCTNSSTEWVRVVDEDVFYQIGIGILHKTSLLPLWKWECGMTAKESTRGFIGLLWNPYLFSITKFSFQKKSQCNFIVLNSKLYCVLSFYWLKLNE